MRVLAQALELAALSTLFVVSICLSVSLSRQYDIRHTGKPQTFVRRRKRNEDVALAGLSYSP